MQIETLRFGSVEVDETKFLKFEEGVPGLEQYHTYALLQFEESYPLVWLQSTEETGICLPVMDTFAVLPEYVFDIDETDVKKLKLTKPEELYVVNVVVIPDDISGMTVNLAAPIVINTTTGKAKQIVLSGTEYNVRVPVFQEICKLVAREEGDSDASPVQESQ